LGLRAKLAELAPQVLWPVLEALRKFSAREGFKPEGLILCLHQYLNLLPFHAMPVDSGGDELLIDRFEVSYAPSLSMLKHGARRRPGGGKTCLIGDPKGDLRFIELVTLAYRRAHPEAEVIHGEDGTVGSFLQRGGQMQRAEIWAHMGAAEDPMDAGIQFAQGEVLRLHQIYRELRLRLRPHLVLNGCESGLMSPVRRPGTKKKGKDPGEVYLTDFDGLPMGFLFAGARSVVSTLWTVYDLSAALLMDRYHQELRGENATPAGALRRASQWLRKEIRNGEDLRGVGEDLLSRVPAEWAWQNADRIEHCRKVLAERAEEHQADPPFAEPLHWASHYVTGWSWGAVVEAEDVGAPANTITLPR
jgi:CHAT domain-containing protein